MAASMGNVVGISPEYDIEELKSLAKEAGPDILTAEEQTALVDYLAKQRVGKNEFKANLADDMNEGDLKKMAQDLLELIDVDEQSRKDWQDKEARGIRLTGVSSETIGGATFKGASRVTHPLLAEAIVQFQARAIAEMWPSSGPVKTMVMGDVTDDITLELRKAEDIFEWEDLDELREVLKERGVNAISR